MNLPSALRTANRNWTPPEPNFISYRLIDGVVHRFGRGGKPLVDRFAAAKRSLTTLVNKTRATLTEVESNDGSLKIILHEVERQ